MKIKIENSSKLFNNITSVVEKEALEWGKSGLVNIYSQHTTAFIKIAEDEILLHADIRFFLDKTFPKIKPDNRRYLHSFDTSFLDHHELLRQFHIQMMGHMHICLEL